MSPLWESGILQYGGIGAPQAGMLQSGMLQYGSLGACRLLLGWRGWFVQGDCGDYGYGRKNRNSLDRMARANPTTKAELFQDRKGHAAVHDNLQL